MRQIKAPIAGNSQGHVTPVCDYQSRVLEFANSNRQINTLLDQILPTTVQVNLDSDIGMTIQKFTDRLRQLTV
jgi:hypothetical protein